MFGSSGAMENHTALFVRHQSGIFNRHAVFWIMGEPEGGMEDFILIHMRHNPESLMSNNKMTRKKP